MLDRTFLALSNKTRREIVGRLLRGEASVGELAEPFAMTLPAISKHIGVLERAGLVHRQRRGRRQVCRVHPERLRPASAWLERHSTFWSGQLGSLGEFLAAQHDQEEDR